MPVFICAVVLGAAAIYGLVNLSAFLTPNIPVKANVLVVEGWLKSPIFDYMLDEAVREIRNGHYTAVLTSGADEDSEQNGKKKNSAERCRERLVEKGIDSRMVFSVAAPAARYHRTYYSAVPVKKWLTTHHFDAVNIFSGGTHGRKTYVIYKRVLGENFSTGIISCKIRHFDSVHWWTSLKGIRVTAGHLLGYVYALCWPFSLLQS